MIMIRLLWRPPEEVTTLFTLQQCRSISSRLPSKPPTSMNSCGPTLQAAWSLLAAAGPLPPGEGVDRCQRVSTARASEGHSIAGVLRSQDRRLICALKSRFAQQGAYGVKEA